MYQDAFNVSLFMLEKMVGGFRLGSMYTVASRPYRGKTTFCMRTAILYAEQDYKVLYLSDSLTREEFDQKLQECDTNARTENIAFVPVFCLSKTRLEQVLNDHPCDLLIVDSIDTLGMDINIGQLKELSLERKMMVWLTKQLARPPLWSRRKHPTLSDIKFMSAKACKKLISYSDAIFFLHNEQSIRKIILAKNQQGYLTEIKIKSSI